MIFDKIYWTSVWNLPKSVEHLLRCHMYQILTVMGKAPALLPPTSTVYFDHYAAMLDPR